MRHIEELNLGPVLNEKQKATKARLAEVDDQLQEETTLLRKLQNVMREKEARVSKVRSKAVSMKKDHESNSKSDSFDIAWGLCQEELQDVEWEWQVLCEEQGIREASIREYRTLKQKIVNELTEETDLKSMTDSRTGRFLRV